MRSAGTSEERQHAEHRCEAVAAVAASVCLAEGQGSYCHSSLGLVLDGYHSPVG